MCVCLYIYNIIYIYISSIYVSTYPPEIKRGWLENTLFTGDFPIEALISSGCPIATFDYRRVSIYIHDYLCIYVSMYLCMKENQVHLGLKYI